MSIESGYCVSRKTCEKYKHYWKIEDFQYCTLPNGKYLESEEFKVSDVNWTLKIYPNGDERKESVDHVSLFLNRVLSDNTADKKVDIVFIIMAKQYGSYVKRGSYVFSNKENFDFGYQKYISRKELFSNDDWLPNGNMIIVCEMKVIPSHNNYKHFVGKGAITHSTLL